MNTTEIIVLAVVVVVLIVAVALYLRRRSTQKLKSKFGPEYDRVLEEIGAPAKAEAQLRTREKRVAAYGLKSLSPEERARFEAEWRRLQGLFVDDPEGVTTGADALLDQVMTARGYPGADFQQRIEDLSVDHAEMVQGYRAAHDVAHSQAQGEVNTEDMRQALIQYRALFDELLGEPETTQATAAAQ